MSQHAHNQDNPWFQSAPNFLEHWNTLFATWQKNVSGTTPGAEAYQNLFVNAGKSFLDMLSAFQAGAGQSKAPHDTAAEWAEGLNAAFTQMFQSATRPQDILNLQDAMLKSGAAFAGAFGQQQKPAGLGAFDPFGFFATMPGIGYTREKQEAWGELYTLWAAYERASQQYNAGMAKVGLEAVQHFQAYLANPPEGTPPLTSLKDIFVKWVDICEDIYAQYAMTQEYTDLYGETVNALMAYKKHLGKLMDDFVDEAGLPTRLETDSLHQRVQQLRRENAQLKKDMEAIKEAVFGKAKPATKSAAKPAPEKAPPKKTAKKTKPAAKGKKGKR
ncbi:MAG: hypothetical protein OXT65_04185 [Alphaproteobacteria bacterium]|nr:hypothetical protein [Alphaproteobacteria bacterium]